MDEDERHEFKRPRIQRALYGVRDGYRKFLKRYKEKTGRKDIDEEKVKRIFHHSYLDYKERLSDKEKIALNGKRVGAFSKLTEVQDLLREMREEHPGASRKEAISILDDALESDRSTIKREVKAVKGERVRKDYDKYSWLFSLLSPEENETKEKEAE